MSERIYVELANRAYSTIYQDYIRLMESVENYPELNHEQFNVKITKVGIKELNTYSLFMYGYQLNIDLTLCFESNGEYLGKISCCLANKKTKVITELYIDQRSDLIYDKDTVYPKGYLGECGTQNTARKFLAHVAQKLLEKSEQ